MAVLVCPFRASLVLRAPIVEWGGCVRGILPSRAYARIRRFFDFCLHLFTIWPQIIVKQRDTGEGFTPIAFTLFRVFAFTAAFTARGCGTVGYL